MIGTLLNVAGILSGGIVGLARKNPLPATTQLFLRSALGAFIVYYGLRLMWVSMNGSVWQIFKQLLIVVVSLMLGRITGRILRLQKFSNHLGQFARKTISELKPGETGNFSDGFRVCAALFCASPLGILGAMGDGLSGYYYPLAVKSVMDGLAAMGFVRMFGSGILLSALPVLAFQGTIALICSQYLGPFLQAHSSPGHDLLNAVNAVGGLLICSIAWIIFEIKKIEIADYLPSLVFAPLLTRLF